MKTLALLLAAVIPASAAHKVIDDAGLMRTFHMQLSKLADKKEAPTGKDLAAALKKAPTRANVKLPDCPGRADYQDAIEGVVVLGSVYRCDSATCKKWHFGPVATAWCVGADGYFVTNHHCFTGGKGAIHGICTLDGKVAVVSKILAGNPRTDSCLIQVDGDGFVPLPLGEAAEVGTKVRVISHPERRYYMQTSGEVARYYKRLSRGSRGTATWMAITADFAKGSSGGPLLDETGSVVGMVSSTQSIYYGNRNKNEKDKDDKGPLQMVVKCCVTGEALRELVGR